MSWKTLLVTTDLSEGSRPGLDLALSLKRQMRLKLHLLHVIDVDEKRGSVADFAPDAAAYHHSMKRYHERVTSESLQAMKEFVRASCSRGRMPDIELDVVFGDVVTSILEHVNQLDADAVVMATHARRGLSHLVLGSVAEHVLHRATRPVVCVRRSDAEKPRR